MHIALRYFQASWSICAPQLELLYTTVLDKLTTSFSPGVPFGQLSWPLKICKGTACQLCFRKSNHTGRPGRARVWLDFLKHSRLAVPLQIFNGQDSWPKGTPDSVLFPLLPQPLQTSFLFSLYILSYFQASATALQLEFIKIHYFALTFVFVFDGYN